MESGGKLPIDAANLLRKALADPNLVQSFSGVRAVLGAGPDISDEHRALATAYGYFYARRSLAQGACSALLGRDPRPTGGSLAAALARGMEAGAQELGCKLELLDLGVITTPLAQTAVRSLEAEGGAMVTASHNPLDHNGFKFITGSRCSLTAGAAPCGALLSAGHMQQIVDDVAALIEPAGLVPDALEKAISEGAPVLRQPSPSSDLSRIQAERSYLDSIGSDWGIAPHCLKPLRLGPVLVDPNGGAGCGIDARVLEHFGVRVIEVNAELGYPEHGIDTDGVDPASGRHMLLRVARAAARERAHFGVAFDYDADRGNLVLPGHDESAIVAPQKVAALNVALALTRRRLSGRADGWLAIVVSDATSLACCDIARAFDAEVFTVETGEINVVTRMAELRREGYDVPVGVEGANGGTIFESSTCRDGLQVALACAQAEASPEIGKTWLASPASRGDRTPADALTLADLVASIPENFNCARKLSAPEMSSTEVFSRIESAFHQTVWPDLSGHFTSSKFERFCGERQVDAHEQGKPGSWRVMLYGKRTDGFLFLRQSRTEAGVWRMIIDASDKTGFGLLTNASDRLWEQASG